MSNPKYNPIRGHEPLRVPQGWTDQARQFVIQLEHLLEDIYQRFSKLKPIVEQVEETADAVQGLTTSLGNVGKRTLVASETVETTTTFAYTGVSVTLTKTSIVSAGLAYYYSATDTIAICSADSGTSCAFLAQARNFDVGGITPSYIWCHAVLGAGTYYIWAKSRSTANNLIYVYKTELESGGGA